MAAVAALLGWLLIGLFHSPTPRKVPVAVVGSGAAATGLAQALEKDGTFKVTVVGTGGEARKLIDDRKIYGAYAPRAKGGVVLTASAASQPVVGLLQAAFTAVDAQRKVTTKFTDVKPLPKGDAAGVSGYFLTLAAVVVAVLGGWWLEVIMPSIRRGPTAAGMRLGTLIVISILTGLILAAVASGVGVYDGKFIELAGIFAFATLGMATVTAAITSLTGGILGLIITMSVFVLFGVLATSGGGSAPEFLPDVWRQIGIALPARETIDLVRNVVYFDHTAITTPLAVLGAYVAAGIVLMMGLSPFRRKTA